MYVGYLYLKSDHDSIKDASSRAAHFVVVSATWRKNELRTKRAMKRHGFAFAGIVLIAMGFSLVITRATRWSRWREFGLIRYTCVTVAEESSIRTPWTSLAGEATA